MKKKIISMAFCRNLLVLLPVLAFYSPTLAQTQSFTVQQAVEFALKNQVSVKNASLDTEIARAEINELVGVGLPQVKANADINRFVEIPTQFIPAEFFGGEPGTYAPVKFGQNYSSSVGISATQLLFDGQYLVGLQASKTYVELARKTLQQTKIETAVNVSKAYYFVLVAEERLKQLSNDLTRLERLKNDTKAMLDNGFVEKIDYDRIELNYNILENAKTQTERMVANSYNLLKFQMGMDMQTPITLSESVAELNLDGAVNLTDSVNHTARIEYSILQTQYKLAGLDLKRYKTSRWPRFELFGNYSYNASRDDFTIFEPGYKWYPTSIVGATVSVPIFGGYKIGYQVMQAKLNRQKVDNAFYSVEQGIHLEHKNAITNFSNNLDRLKTQEKNRNLAREIARVSKIKYEQGVGSNLEVIDAESSLRDAENNYYSALIETIISKIDLDKASGSIKY